MNNSKRVSAQNFTEQTRVEITLLHELLTQETDGAKRAGLQEEILCLAHSWLVLEMFVDDEV